MNNLEMETARADQSGRNCMWLVKKIEIMHSILCPGEYGTWQERTEQVVNAVKLHNNGTNQIWLIKQFDILHNILCPKESGNWQEEVEQVVKAVVKLQEERWRKVVKEKLDESNPVSL